MIDCVQTWATVYSIILSTVRRRRISSKLSVCATIMSPILILSCHTLTLSHLSGNIQIPQTSQTYPGVVNYQECRNVTQAPQIKIVFYSFAICFSFADFQPYHGSIWYTQVEKWADLYANIYNLWKIFSFGHPPIVDMLEKMKRFCFISILFYVWCSSWNIL